MQKYKKEKKIQVGRNEWRSLTTVLKMKFDRTERDISFKEKLPRYKNRKKSTKPENSNT